MDPNIQNLKNYISQQLQNQLTSSEIQQQLIHAGHSQENINQAFALVQQEVMPAPVAPGMQSTDHVSPANRPQANGQKRGRLKTAWILLKQSIKVLRGNPDLLRYLGMTYAWIMLTIGVSIAIVFFFGGNLFAPQPESEEVPPIAYVFALISYLVTYFIINYYAAALAANMLDIFSGQKRNYADYMAVVRKKIGPIFVFSLISAVIGVFLEYVVERFKFVGWIVAYILGTAWSLGTMFVLPIIVKEEVGAPQAIKTSLGFFKQTWGENIAAKVTVNLPLGLLQIALLIGFIFSMFAVVMTGSAILIIAIFILYLLATISLAIIGSFANSLINTALYYYAANNEIPSAFTEEMLNSVFVQKKKRKFFGRSES